MYIFVSHRHSNNFEKETIDFSGKAFPSRFVRTAKLAEQSKLGTQKRCVIRMIRNDSRIEAEFRMERSSLIISFGSSRIPASSGSRCSKQSVDCFNLYLLSACDPQSADFTRGAVKTKLQFRGEFASLLLRAPRLKILSLTQSLSSASSSAISAN